MFDIKSKTPKEKAKICVKHIISIAKQQEIIDYWEKSIN